MAPDHYENFPVASRLLPARLRPAVAALYRYARSADDLADEGDVPSESRLAALDTYEAALDVLEAAGGSPPPPS
ncbi:MAG: squalene/phytoene synthase family protein, partial [Pigmentiphaga sp.]